MPTIVDPRPSCRSLLYGQIQRNDPMLNRFQQYSSSEAFIAICVLIVAVAFNLVNLYSGFLVGVSDGTDTVLHRLLSEAVVDAIITGKNFTDPWQSSMGMGHPVSHYYQHLPHVGLIHVLTFQVFPVADIVNWTTYLLFSVFPLSIYWSLRRFGFDQLMSPMGGLVASLVATSANAGFGYSSYVVGGLSLYTQLWAMVLTPVALAWGYRVLQEGRGYFWAVLLISATLMSHLLYGYMAFLTLAVLAVIVSKVQWSRSSPALAEPAHAPVAALLALAPLPVLAQPAQAAPGAFRHQAQRGGSLLSSWAICPA